MTDVNSEAPAPVVKVGRSEALFARAERVIPGGVGSSARGPRAGWTPYPPFISHGEGSRVWDVDGREYVDYLLGLGPMLLGHRPPRLTRAVVQAVDRRVGHGTRFPETSACAKEAALETERTGSRPHSVYRV